MAREHGLQQTIISSCPGLFLGLAFLLGLATGWFLSIDMEDIAFSPSPATFKQWLGRMAEKHSCEKIQWLKRPFSKIIQLRLPDHQLLVI